MTGRAPAPAMAPERRRRLSPARLGAMPALVAMAFLMGDIGDPRASSSQESTGAAPYHIVRPPGDGPHLAVLFVSGCSGFAPHEAPDHYPRVAAEFAARGFVVVFVDYLGARGRQVCGGKISP